MRWLNKQGVESDKGFVVQFTGRSSVEYREDGRVLTIYVESSGESSGLGDEYVCEDAFDRWDNDPPDMLNSASEKARIYSNLAEAFAFQGLRLVIQPRPGPMARDEFIARILAMHPKVQLGD